MKESVCLAEKNPSLHTCPSKKDHAGVEDVVYVPQ
jgi:hypothetical protein